MYTFNRATTKEVAIWCAKNEISVFPAHFPISQSVCTCGKTGCAQIGKHPKTSDGFKSATTDEDVIRRWLKQDSPFNLCIATGSASGIIVLDEDTYKGGNHSLSALEKKYGLLPQTWMSTTGGGGRHFIFRHPGFKVKNRTCFMPGLDVRGDGGYIVAPPSVHKSGRSYEWDVLGRPNEVELADAPDWLLKEIAETNKPNSSVASKLHENAKSPAIWRNEFRKKLNEGERNSKITSFAGHLLGKKIDPYVTLELLIAFNEARGNPPLDDDEIYRCVHSIVKSEIANRKGK